MGTDSHIQWCHHTFNIVIGCVEVANSPACDNCYARAMAKRAGWDVWGADKPRKILREEYWKQPSKWNRRAATAGERHRVFCSSMADVFEDHPTVAEQRERLWPAIESTSHLDWLLLTKRPQNIMAMVPERWRRALPKNVWCGTTVESQAMAVERIPHLLRVPAVVRFLSCEPLLEQLNLDPPTCPSCGRHEFVLGTDGGTPFCPECEDEMSFHAWLDPCADEYQAGINWVICGGESGSNEKARPFDLAWARETVRQCRDASVPVFVKQLGSKPVLDLKPTGNFRTNETTGKRQFEMTCERLYLEDRAGGDPTEWPEDLRVREFPEVTPVAERTVPDVHS